MARKLKFIQNSIKILTPVGSNFSCNAVWALTALSGLKYVKNAQPAIKKKK